jgi:hypothetical protein
VPFWPEIRFAAAGIRVASRVISPRERSSGREKESVMKIRFITAAGLALLLAIASLETNVMAYEGYGTGNCSLWAKIKAEIYGVDCHYFMHN